MYDYELEKSLEERQAESLEINLNRNKKNRAYSKKMKIVYIFIAALFVVSIGIVLIIGEDIYMNFWFALSIDLFVSALIFAIVRRCPHCGVSLTPSDSLTAIEKRRESEKSGKDPDLK